ncbi:protein containing Y_Y_Y domain [Lentimicrobium saccharophilum]|uniref:Protein containing Y_Y_Y domain n=2 Tax=Lentimicrobium saccharophilum TaxID=1678841 RepID=A0A0S7C0W1_9BACT|nr:protein containing Y_Y_Y domain [Lentimicrobium saccharophilum]
MTRIFRFIFLTFLFLVTSVVAGQHPVFRHYSVDDGLPSSEVYHVFQDSKSYIWLATNMGVSRFDGREFRNFDVQDGLPENTVFEIYEDEAGRVWFVGFPFQLSYFEGDSIYKYKYNEVLRSLTGKGHVPVKKSFKVDRNGGVYFTLLRKHSVINIMPSGKVNYINGKNKDFKGVSILEIEDHLFIYQFSENLDDLLKVEVYTNEISKEIEIIRSRTYSFGNLLVLKGEKGEVYFTYNDILVKLWPDGNYVMVNSDDRVFWMNLDENGNLWVGKDKSGISVYEDGNIQSEPLVKYLEGLSISSMVIDNEGGRWFTTLEDGVFYLASESFYSFQVSDGLSSNKINCLAIAGGKIVAGMNDPYINILQGNVITKVKISETPNGVIYALEEETNEKLWIGTNDYLYSYDWMKVTKHENNHKYYRTSNINSRKVFNIKDLFFDGNGKLYLGEAAGLTIAEDGQVIYNSLLDDDIELRVETITRYGKSKLLLGTTSGLWQFTDGKFEYIGALDPMLKNRITSIVTTSNDEIKVFGTKGFGVLVHTNDTTIYLNSSHGLTSNSVTSLLITGNLLWIATNNGLNCLDLTKVGTDEMKIVIFSKQHGLISNEINQIAGNQELIYIATNEGLTVFNYKDYKPVTEPPPIFINGFSVIEEDMPVKSGYFFRHNQNFISIRFTGISFRDAGNLVYKYRLKGLGEDWISTSNSQVEYAFLPPGEYQFEVIAVNSDSLQSSGPAIISFVILPPFWRTWWFITLIVLVGSGLALLFYSYRIKQIRREAVLRNDISWYRQQALARQMDPHFVFNTLNSIQSYIIKNDRLSSSQYLTKFSRLMRLMLNNSQSHAVSLNDEVSALNIYLELESIRFQEKFDFHLNIDPVIEPEVCYIPAFLIQPFIENSIWHGIMGIDRPGCIRVDLKLNETGNQIICTVEDNGKGRAQSMAENSQNDRNRKSLGISIVESRLSLLNSLYGIEMKIIYTDLYDNQGKPAGTRVRINLPIIL